MSLSKNSIIYIITESILIYLIFFSLWIVFSYFSAYMRILTEWQTNWILHYYVQNVLFLEILFSLLLGPSKIIWKQISSLLLSCVRWNQNRFNSRGYLDLTEVEYLWVFNWTSDILWDFSPLAVGNMNCYSSLVWALAISPAHLQWSFSSCAFTDQCLANDWEKCSQSPGQSSSSTFPVLSPLYSVLRMPVLLTSLNSHLCLHNLRRPYTLFGFLLLTSGFGNSLQTVN